MTQSDIRKMLNDLDASNADRETLKQKCHELENQVNLLQDEKTNMSVEFEQLQAQVSGQIYANMLLNFKLKIISRLFDDIYFQLGNISGDGKGYVENGGNWKWSRKYSNQTAQKATRSHARRLVQNGKGKLLSVRFVG